MSPPGATLSSTLLLLSSWTWPSLTHTPLGPLDPSQPVPAPRSALLLDYALAAPPGPALSLSRVTAHRPAWCTAGARAAVGEEWLDGPSSELDFLSLSTHSGAPGTPPRSPVPASPSAVPAPETEGGDSWQVFGQWPPEGLPTALQVETSSLASSSLLCDLGQATPPLWTSVSSTAKWGRKPTTRTTHQALQWWQLTGSPLPTAETGSKAQGLRKRPLWLLEAPQSPTSWNPAPTCAGINSQHRQPAASRQGCWAICPPPARPLPSQAEGAICWAWGTWHPLSPHSGYDP